MVRQGTRWESIFRLDNAGLVLGCGTLLAAGLVIMQILLVRSQGIYGEAEI